jgi:hypothetical protein
MDGPQGHLACKTNPTKWMEQRNRQFIVSLMLFQPCLCLLLLIFTKERLFNLQSFDSKRLKPSKYCQYQCL